MDDSDNKYTLNKDDRLKWENYVKDINSKSAEQPQEENFESLLNKTKISKEIPEQHSTQQEQTKTIPQEPSQQTKLNATQPQLDRRTADRLRKGKIPIEGRLDLHGMTKTQAHGKLLEFITKCHKKNLRCVLIITGKGKSKTTSEDWLSPSQGILKENVPFWLSITPFKEKILKTYQAQPKDGGTGALYVYLKKKRI